MIGSESVLVLKIKKNELFEQHGIFSNRFHHGREDKFVLVDLFVLAKKAEL